LYWPGFLVACLATMRDMLLFAVHLFVILAKFARPGGVRSVWGANSPSIA
jgi:hypothetical protein